MVSGVYTMMLLFDPTRTFPAGGRHNGMMQSLNVDSDDGGRAPAPDKNGANTGNYKDEKKNKNCYVYGSEDHLIKECPVDKD